MTKSLKEKRFRYGTFSTAMMLFAVILFILINLVADEFNRSFDLTPDGIFTLSWRTHDFLETLDQDVTITHVVSLGQGHHWTPIVTQLLEEYDSSSRHITVQERDPMISPALIHQFAEAAGLDEGIHDGSVVVQSGDRIRVLGLTDMLIVDRDWMGRPTNIRSYSFEAEITRAIHYVTLGDPPIVYYVTGSGEHELPAMLTRFLESESFVIREVNLVTSEVPETADILLVPMPSRDWTEVKAQRVLNYLENEGRAFFAVNLTLEEMPNFNSVLASYGVAPINHLVLEGDQRNIFQQYAHFILPTLTNHEINENLRDRNLANLMVGAIGIETLDIRRGSTNVESIWTTSRDAFARVDTEETTMARVPGDMAGPFDLAVAITDTRFVERTHTTQLVVVGNMVVLSDGILNLTGIGNFQFILDSLRWLHGQPPSLFIPGRIPPGAAPLVLTQFNANVMNGIAVAGLPLLSIVIGIVVWLKRRHN
ncbi:MAG: GldG family protein [Firmicutes bacterium]|nr:GldG family protein [Bacillota bacterium]